MLREHFKCSLPLPTGHIVGKMHMSSKCTQHVNTGFQAPSPPVNADLISQLRGVDTQMSSDDPTGIICKNTANDLRKIWRRSSPNTNCWNRKSLHSFRNRERLWTPNSIRLQKATWELLRPYDFVVVASQLLCMGATLSALQAS